MPFAWPASVVAHAALISVDGSAVEWRGERELSKPASLTEIGATMLPFVWLALLEAHAALTSVAGSTADLRGERERARPACRTDGGVMLLPFVWFASVEVHAALFSVDGSAPDCGGERERSSPANCSEMKSGRCFSLGDDAVATAVVVVGEPALLPATVAAGEGVGGCTGHARPSPDTANFKIRSRRMSLTELYSVRVTSSALGWISSFTNAASNTTGAASSGACADSTSGVEFSL